LAKIENPYKEPEKTKHLLNIFIVWKNQALI